jgi:DNA-binding NarL/FixJ family response regulator
MDCPTLECIGEGGFDGDALEGIAVAQPDVLIVDLDIHDQRIRTVLKRLVSKTPGTRIIALSATDDKRFVLRLLRYGVLGYISHAEATTELIRAIEAVARGDVFLCPSASVALLSEYRKRAWRHTQNSQGSGRQPKSQGARRKT